jgi:hypothetical protein
MAELWTNFFKDGTISFVHNVCSEHNYIDVNRSLLFCVDGVGANNKSPAGLIGHWQKCLSSSLTPSCWISNALRITIEETSSAVQLLKIGRVVSGGRKGRKPPSIPKSWPFSNDHENNLSFQIFWKTQLYFKIFARNLKHFIVLSCNRSTLIKTSCKVQVLSYVKAIILR